MKPVLTICLAAAWALALPAAQPPAPPGPGATSSADEGKESLLDGGLLDDSDVPIALPVIVDELTPRRAVPAIPEGAAVFDRRARLRRGREDRWWVVDDPKAVELRLLPCHRVGL